MKVLFIGGTGLISTAVSKLAIESGMELYLLNRGRRGLFVPDGAKSITADIRDEDSVRKALEGYGFDVVVDWIAFMPEQVEADIRLFSGATSQFIFISSASAYQKPVTYHIITESTPLANPYWQYSRDKIACEAEADTRIQGEGLSCDDSEAYFDLRLDDDTIPGFELEPPMDAGGQDEEGNKRWQCPAMGRPSSR